MTEATQPIPFGSLSAVILAGGKSQRMGHDKALLQVEDEPLLARTCRIATTICVTVSVVTPWGDRYRPWLPDAVAIIPEVPSSDEKPAGPLMGFLQALPLQKTDWVLLLACDLPRLEASVLQHWGQALAELPDSVLAYVPQTEQGWEPLCGFYRKTSLKSLQEFAARGDRSFQQWLNTIPAHPITPIPADCLFNCNTPDDWATLQSQ